MGSREGGIKGDRVTEREIRRKAERNLTKGKWNGSLKESIEKECE